MKRLKSNRRLPEYLLLLAVVFALVWLFAGDRKPARAQSGTFRFAVVDTEKILLESNAGRAMTAELRKLRENLEAQGNQQQDELNNLRQKLTEGRGSLSEDKLRELERQIETKQTDLRRFQDDATRQLNKKRDEMLQSIDAQVMPVIRAVGKESELGAIFRKYESGLIYTDDSIEITGMVIDRMNNSKNAD